jgi:hypothetical protein
MKCGVITRGDHAAHDLLEQISAELPGNAKAALLEEVRLHYNAYDLIATRTGILRLKAQRQAQSSTV